MSASVLILEDARDIFDSYLRATSSFVRAKPLSIEVFEYPQDTIQTDCVAFAHIFSCVWQAIKSEFEDNYARKLNSFAKLVTIVTPGADTDAPYAGFWVQDKKGGNLVSVSPSTKDSVRELCRTLRNGFDHFNFRYINVTPRDYFQRLGLTLPGIVINPDLASNYRIFICDWDSNRAGFMEPTSDTRVIGTQFARLRYSLFRFLVDFFTEPGRTPYRDILTLAPLT
jgi:hypothetical protein